MPTVKLTRIYQGRVSGVSLIESDGSERVLPPPAESLTDDFVTLLWQNHVAFQTAVNYYLFALSAMAAGLSEGHPLREWRTQVQNCWQRMERGARNWHWPFAGVARLFGLDAAATTPDELEQAIFALSRSTPPLRAAALQALCERQGGLNRTVEDDLGRLCDSRPGYRKTPKASVASKNRAAQGGLRRLVATPLEQRSRALREFNPYVLKFSAGEPLSARAAQREIRKRIDDASKRSTRVRAIAETLRQELASMAEPPCLRASGGKENNAVFGATLLAHVFPDSEAVWELFAQTTKSFLEQDFTASEDDPLDAVRVEGTVVFDFFSNLAVVRSADAQETRAAWYELDKAAFIEALNFPRRYLADMQKRDEELRDVQNQIAMIEGSGGEVRLDRDESELGRLDGFAGDPRRSDIERLLRDRLGYDNELGTREEFALRERTLRCYEEVRQTYLTARFEGRASREELVTEMRRIQGRHRSDFGYARLYEALADPEFHSIWLPVPANQRQDHHAENALELYRELQDLRREQERLSRPIRFTPAHAVHSPRFWTLPKTGAGGTAHRPLRTADQTFTMNSDLLVTARTQPGRYQRSRAVLHFAAPRLLRDELREEGETDLEQRPWLPPLVAALPQEQHPDLQDFDRTPAELTFVRATREGRERAAHLSFSVQIDPDRTVVGLGRTDQWSQEFIAIFKQRKVDRYLRLAWPGRDTKWRPTWHTRVNPFQVLAVDAGQRYPAALALLEASSATAPAAQPASRRIGVTPDGVEWRARTLATRVVRLLGEDAKVWRGQTELDQAKPDDSGKEFDFREELSGDRGRKPTAGEIQEASNLFEAFLGPNRTHWPVPDDWQRTLTFPEHNDKLLVAARWAQRRLGRCLSWGWRLRDNAERESTLDELAALDLDVPYPAGLRNAGNARDVVQAADLLRAEVDRLREALPRSLVQLAARIAPLRDRSWQWRSNTDAPEFFKLDDTGPAPGTSLRVRGQRGLSLDRIRQLEDLRERFQSLNHTFRLLFAVKPPRLTWEDRARVPEPCPGLLKKIDHLKSQRINHTANAILAEALGLRLTPPGPDKVESRTERDVHGRYERIPGRQPVDFIAIENLTGYRTSQRRAPSENRRLMQWCQRQVVAKLKQLCEPFGILVVEVGTAYSSQFCSRSGIAGFRADELFPEDAGRYPWRELLNEARERTADARPEAQHAAWVFDQLAALNAARPANRRLGLLAPREGGPLFVRAWDAGPPCAGAPEPVWHADLNAAVNIGLRAIASRDERTVFPRLAPAERDAQRLWIDVSGQIPGGQPLAASDPQHVLTRPELQQAVRQRQWERCLLLNRERMRRWHREHGTPLPVDEDDLPMEPA